MAPHVPLRTILFDLGNVLVHFSHERMYTQIGQICGLPQAEMRTQVEESGLHIEFECGRLSECEFHERLQQQLGRSIDRPDLRRTVADIFELNEAMMPVLDRLREAGLRLVLLSNTNETHITWVRERFNVLDRFDALVLSYEVGAVKPDDAIYRAALEAIDCDPTECFYTDDIADYVHKARGHGLQAEVFTGVSELRRHLMERGLNV
ncbi:Alpha-D-glucose-1-phosphate phosphatase YihX [Maioricimonas rarisocia]|uniref:Alpha-D-glucose-1-phosphate phosphatase YihX n=1 Tax=Maioricimonas rarisocia TaxID=2528026 RepID=A0A517Z7G4_9PLAN|nr:HAD family phosphatase [Maioricimonas rarisocia]QDU38426.1 Alpha-D-glucose-1-phosphate phosphatase YihX [Maioricimonas rarisocia]